MPKGVKKIKLEKKESSVFSASLSFGKDSAGTEKLYESQGDTILECLNSLKFDLTKTAAVLTVKGNNKTAERVMYPLHLKRLMVKVSQLVGLEVPHLVEEDPIATNQKNILTGRFCGFW